MNILHKPDEYDKYIGKCRNCKCIVGALLGELHVSENATNGTLLVADCPDCNHEIIFFHEESAYGVMISREAGEPRKC